MRCTAFLSPILPFPSRDFCSRPHISKPTRLPCVSFLHFLIIDQHTTNTKIHTLLPSTKRNSFFLLITSIDKPGHPKSQLLLFLSRNRSHLQKPQVLIIFLSPGSITTPSYYFAFFSICKWGCEVVFKGCEGVVRRWWLLIVWWRRNKYVTTTKPITEYC